jgi:hypothetical protein
MSIDVPTGHPLYSFGKAPDNHKHTVKEFQEFEKKLIENGGNKEIKELWDELKKYSTGNINNLKRGDKDTGKPEYKPIGTDYHIYMINMRADTYDAYFKASDGKGGEDKFKDGIKATLEREKLRYEYIQALKESKDYKDLPEAKKDEFITEKLKKTYVLVENGGHMSISSYSNTKSIKELLDAQKTQNAKDAKEKETAPKERGSLDMDEGMRRSLAQFNDPSYRPSVSYASSSSATPSAPKINNGVILG